MGKKKNRSQKECEFSPEIIEADPSFNARQVVNAAIKRIDDLSKQHDKSNHDLRKADERLRNFRFKEIRDRERLVDRHNKELRASDREIRVGEKERLHSIREVDQTNATNTAINIAASVQTLATNANINADNLRNQLNSTASTMQKNTSDLATTLATQQAARDETNNKRFTALEQTSYVGQGKEKVTDPMMEKYMTTMDAIVTKLAESKGKETVTDPIVTQSLVDIKTLLSTRSENVGGKVTTKEIIAYILAAIAVGGFVGQYL